MSQTYRAVQWNRQKRRYDVLLAVAVLLSLVSFVAVGAWVRPSLTLETLLIRGIGGTAFLLLHVILAIGPICRLDRRFLPMLYNRRHLGVCMAGLALVHGGFSIFQFHALSNLDPLVSVLVGDPPSIGFAGGPIELPFQIFGLGALVILVVLAATSHDFWLALLTPRIWKWIHMSVYMAYGLLVAHVAFGVLQSEASPVYPALLFAGMVLLAGLHLAAAQREHTNVRGAQSEGSSSFEAFVFACTVDWIREGRARVVEVAGERVAIFRHGGRLSAVSNVCAHQSGPLGEGRILDGCIVCPWHAYQYDPATGRAPAPYTERIATYDLRLEGRDLFVRSRPNPPGTPIEPLAIEGAVAALGPDVRPNDEPDDFYVGFDLLAPPLLARFLRHRVGALVLIAPGVLALMAAAQGAVVPSVFEFGLEREFVGWIGEDPVPTLSVLRPGDPGTCGAASIHPLVATGKRGAASAVDGFDGEQVRLRGTLIHLDGEALIELADSPIFRVDDLAAAVTTAGPAARRESLGRHRLVGEIVDSKCHYGVMNPGSGKVHRACAMRCIEGGIPPAFRIDGSAGERAVLLLVDPTGRGVGSAVRSWIGRSVALEGEVVRHGDLLVFAIDPTRIEGAEP